MNKLIRIIRNICQGLSSFIIQRKKAVIVSLINAIILLFVTYFINNSPLFTGENLNLYTGLEYVSGGKGYVNDSVLLINIAYDKNIAIKKINGLVVGNTDVTDRESLIKLLRYLKEMPKDSSYRYIFLDVRFEEGDSTKYDKMLFAEIKSTPRLVAANHRDIVLASEDLKDKAAYSDFLITLTSNNFVRYQFLRCQGESMPLRAYHELYDDSIRNYFGFYTCNKGLCQNTHVVRSVLNMDDNNSESNNGTSMLGEHSYKNLNAINNYPSLSILARNKYVIVGNMIDDKHDTFFGKIPGSVLLFSAYWSLKNGDNMVKPWIELLLFLLFFGISFSLFSKTPIIERISWVRNTKSKLLRFLITFLGYSTVLFLATVILYLFYNVIYSIWIPALYFSIQKTYFTYKYMKI